MDYKNDKEKLKDFKNIVIQQIDEFLNNEIEQDTKKTSNLVYWLRDYKNYLKQEKTFKARYLPLYRQGSIVQVNFGFNIGVELGGLHYAVVLSNNDNVKNESLIVVPLSSMKDGKTVRDLKKSEVYLGNEIYNLLELKIFKLKNELYQSAMRGDELKKKLQILDDCIKKFSKMKKGSYAKTSQITTISKIRVRDPLNRESPLYNIVINKELQEKINNNINNILKST